MILYFILSTFIHWNSIRNNCSFPPLIYSAIYISKDSFIYQPYSTLWVIIQYYGYVFLTLFQLWSLGDLSSWLWSKSWFEIWKGVKCWCLVLPHRECGHGVLIIILRALQVLKWEVSSGHWASPICDKSRKPIHWPWDWKALGSPQGPIPSPVDHRYIYIAPFSWGKQTEGISHLFIRKKHKRKNLRSPRVYTGTSRTTKFKRERKDLSGPGLTVLTDPIPAPLSASIPELSLIQLSRNPMI